MTCEEAAREIMNDLRRSGVDVGAGEARARLVVLPIVERIAASVRAEVIREAAKESCDLCHEGRPLESIEDGLGEFYHVGENGEDNFEGDDTWNERYCGASGMWLRWPEALIAQDAAKDSR